MSRRPRAHDPATRLLPLGALAAGFGLLGLPAHAQVPAAAPAASAASARPAPPETTMKPIAVKAKVETDATSLRAATTGAARGTQALRDIPQSITVVTEKLMQDRRVDTLKQALHQTAGVTFQAAEGGEEDVRLRGFSLATSGDIYVDNVRDPAFYERDTFAFDRVEVLRGSASMLFGRGSTGGVVNQATKRPFLANANEVSVTAGDGGFFRVTGDFNLKLSDTSAARLNLMTNEASGGGGNDRLDKQGVAPSVRWGIGTDDEVRLAGYWLRNANGINYGLPWLRQKGQPNAATPQDTSAANPGGLIRGLDPGVFYGAASDLNRGEAAHATLDWTHRFADGGRLVAVLRQGRYDRDQRAGTVRFFVNTNPALGPVVLAPGADGPSVVTDATPIVRGTNNKVQNLATTDLQLGISRSVSAFGLGHDLLAGLDLSREVFQGYATVLPAGVVLDKNTPRTTFGAPDDGTGGVDESRRSVRRQAAFDARSVGVYLQDLVQVAPAWKLLGGVRLDVVKGDYPRFQTAEGGAVPVGTELQPHYGRSDRLPSTRAGVLFQPTDALSFHLSYGTSFNTSGDAFQYDLPGSNTPPEKSRNLELGAKMELFDGGLSTRLALFQATKFDERNRDSPDGTPLADYVLSGRRHTAGAELDLAGRILPGWEAYLSYAFVPVARIDAGPPSGVALTGERVGDRPSLTPRHSGTAWTTWQALGWLRVGGGLNFRSRQTPNRNPPGIEAPGYATIDLLAEATLNDAVGFRLNLLNAANKLYADSLYTAHYIPGLGRQVQLTMTARF